MSDERGEHDGGQIRRRDECRDAAREVITGSREHHGASLSEMLRGSGSASPGDDGEGPRKEKLHLHSEHKREERGSTVRKNEKKGFLERMKDKLLDRH